MNKELFETGTYKLMTTDALSYDEINLLLNNRQEENHVTCSKESKSP